MIQFETSFSKLIHEFVFIKLPSLGQVSVSIEFPLFKDIFQQGIFLYFSLSISLKKCRTHYVH